MASAITAAIRDYAMSDADIARQSNDSEGYLIIEGEAGVDASLEVEVQEDFSVQKVGSENDDGSPKRQVVDPDEIADILNDGMDDHAHQQDDDPDLGGDNLEVVAEDEIAVVKLGDVEASAGIQWPESNEEERAEDDLIKGETPAVDAEEDGLQQEEARREEEPVLIEVNGTAEEATPGGEEDSNEGALIDTEPAAEEDEPVAAREEPEIDDTPVIIEDRPEIEITRDVQELDEDTLVVGDEPTPAETEPVAAAAEPVVVEVNGNGLHHDEEVEDEGTEVDGVSSTVAGTVDIDVSLGGGERREEEERREEPKEDTTEEKAPPAKKPHGSLSLSERIRAFEMKQKDGNFVFDGDRSIAMEEIAATEAQTTESTPAVPGQDGVVRSSDAVEEKMTVTGGTKSILEQFKKGDVSNVEIKRTIDSEQVTVHSLEEFQPPPKDDDEVDTHVKPQDLVSSTDRDEGQTAESEPQRPREGVVRGETFEDLPKGGEGLKNLKSMWEKGGVSNAESRVERERIEVRSLEDVDASVASASAVAENTPAARRADVLGADVSTEDPGISSGLAQRIKAQFEQGPVHNIEERPKPVLERPPGSLEDYHEGDTSQSVSESTPQRREDVIRSDVPLEEQAHASEGTRSLLSRWEKGEVEHAEEKPKGEPEDPRSFKGEYAESSPQIRVDLAREGDQIDEKVPEGLAKNISQTIEGGSMAAGSGEGGVEFQVEVNGNVSSPTENGDNDESTLNGHYQNDEEGAVLDTSAEIKAARAAAAAAEDGDEDQSAILVESR